jgi:hypothetical protein
VTAPDPRLGEIEARAAAATPGPWESGRGATSDGTEFVTTYEQKSAFLALSLNSGRSCLWLVYNGEVIPAVTGDGPRAQANAKFIASAPADVAYLLTELRKRDEVIARVEALAEEFDRESVASRNVEREIRKGPPSTLSFVHAQHATIAHNHASRIRAAVTAAKGDGEL